MRLLYRGDLAEILDLGEGVYRIYCEGISQSREDDILGGLEVDRIIQSKTNGQYDGALIIDFNEKDYYRVLRYFTGVTDGE